MTLIEVLVPKGSLSEAERSDLGERLVTELLSGDGVPADLLARARAMAWLVIHEPQAWAIGGRPVAMHDPPRFLVRLTVPGGHLNEPQRAEAVARITRALSDFAGDGDRLYRVPDAWVQIVEAPDRSLGLFGQLVGTADLIKLVVDPDHAAALRSRADASPVAETLIDPICGMAVELNDSAITLEHDGAIVAFCSAGCRDLFAAAHGAES